ncbi:MAG: phosphoribosyltransferase [Roseiarcus sp.]|jgi:predicted phosphoribosyltransferase
MPFLDRADAGRQLARALASYKGRNPVVLALPRGGVPIGAEIATSLEAPLDIVLVRKIGAPYQPELAMGAVVDGGEPIVARNEEVIDAMGVNEREFKAACSRELIEIERRRQRFLGERRRVEIAGRVAIVTDDGVATGATARAALRAIRKRRPKELVLAVPVAASDTVEALRSEVDALVCLEAPRRFGAVGSFYADFRQVTDEEVNAILARFPVPKPAKS